MILNVKMRLTIAMSAALLFAAPSAVGKKGGGDHDRGDHDRGDHDRGEHGRGKFRGGYQKHNRNYDFGHNRGFYNGGGARYYAAPRYYAPSRAYYDGGFTAGRFYAGRGYFYGGSFWARPFFGVGIGIPFGYGYRTPRGCGYVDEFGDFYPAPCYSNNGYRSGYDPNY